MKELKFKGKDNFISGFFEVFKNNLEKRGFKKILDTHTEKEKIIEYEKKKDKIVVEIKDIEPFESELKISGENIDFIIYESLKVYIKENILPIIRYISFEKAKKFEDFLESL
ncbi:MAG: hypothetical protein ABIN20_01205 [candidate division WOR-3 bacterium]